MSSWIFIVFMGIMMIVALNYGQTMMASTDIGIDLSGTEYNNTYNNATSQIRTSMTFMGILPYIIGVAALIAALFLMFPNGGNYI